MVIRINSGTTENTNQWTYNGSTGKTINITPGSLASGLHWANLTVSTAASNTTEPTFGAVTLNGRAAEATGRKDNFFIPALGAKTDIGTLRNGFFRTGAESNAATFTNARTTDTNAGTYLAFEAYNDATNGSAYSVLNLDTYGRMYYKASKETNST